MTQPDLFMINAHLIELYGQRPGSEAFEQMRAILNRYRDLPAPHGNGAEILSERDSILITYADQLSEPDALPLQTLTRFCERHLSGLISRIHL